MRRACWIIRTSLWALLLTGYAAAVAAQPIPTHPRELTFDPIEFDPPEASVHRHIMSNGVVVFVVSKKQSEHCYAESDLLLRSTEDILGSLPAPDRPAFTPPSAWV